MKSGAIKNWLAHFPDDSDVEITVESTDDSTVAPQIFLNVILSDGTRFLFPNRP